MVGLEKFPSHLKSGRGNCTSLRPEEARIRWHWLNHSMGMYFAWSSLATSSTLFTLSCWIFYLVLTVEGTTPTPRVGDERVKARQSGTRSAGSGRAKCVASGDNQDAGTMW